MFDIWKNHKVDLREQTEKQLEVTGLFLYFKMSIFQRVFYPRIACAHQLPGLPIGARAVSPRRRDGGFREEGFNPAPH